MANVITDSNGNVLTVNGGAFTVDASVDANITAGNIKKNVSILGVTGTYEGGEGMGENDVNFRDYDGTVVASYSAEEFAELSALPANPFHTGLTAQGWNWTLANAKTFVAAHGGLEIGQMYVTDDGKTRLYLDLPYPGQVKMTFTVSGSDTGSGSNIIDWGDGSTTALSTGEKTHTYVTAGKFMVTIECNEGRTYTLGTASNDPAKSDFTHTCIYKAELGNRVGLLKAFDNCFNLESVTMPLGLDSHTLGANSFYATKLKHLTVPSDITDIGAHALNCYRGAALLESVSLPNGLLTIQDASFSNNKNFTRFFLPETVTSFAGPSSTITSSGYAFQNSQILERINIPTNLTIVGKGAFEYCYFLKDVVLPSGLTGIGESAFHECKTLREITIPANVNDIRASAFSGCWQLTDVYLLPTTPPTLENKNAFPNNPTTIHVPHGYLEDYQTASVWSGLASQMVEMPE